jgi:hypothetical protein
MSKTVIQKLIKKSTTIHYSGPGEIEEFDKEKFAELLVRECANIQEGRHEAEMILKHVGLKIKS